MSSNGNSGESPDLIGNQANMTNHFRCGHRHDNVVFASREIPATLYPTYHFRHFGFRGSKSLGYMISRAQGALVWTQPPFGPGLGIRIDPQL